jgi:hypothetical protein
MFAALQADDRVGARCARPLSATETLAGSAPLARAFSASLTPFALRRGARSAPLRREGPAPSGTAT